MSHASGFVYSAQSVSGPAPIISKFSPSSKPRMPGTNLSRRPRTVYNRPSVLFCDENTQSPSPSPSPSQNRSRANLAPEHGSANGADRKRHRSPASPCSISNAQTTDRIRSRRHASPHAKAPPVTRCHSGHGLTKSEFELCRQSIRSAFQKCTDLEYLRLSVIISCLLNCFEPLHVTEMTAVLVLIFAKQPGSQERSQHSEDGILTSLRLKCGQLFFEDAKGYFRFSHPLIPTFLLAYPIQGVDQSHALLAKACVTRIEVEGGLQKSGSAGWSQSACQPGAFSVYAAKHWEEHYRRAERRNASLTARVHRMIWTALAKEQSTMMCDKFDLRCRRAAVDEAQAFCAERRFRVLCGAYAHCLAGIDAVSGLDGPREDADCMYDSGISLTEGLGFESVFADLKLAESDGDSDDWFFV